MSGQRDAIISAPVAVASIRQPPASKAEALIRAVETVLRHLKGTVAALEELREELKK